MKKKGLLGLMLVMLLLCIASAVFAGAEEGGVSGEEPKAKADVLVGVAAALGAAFAISLAAAGGAIGQGKAISTALEGIARNPGAAGKVMTPMIIGLAMVESLVIYALVIALILVNKVPG